MRSEKRLNRKRIQQTSIEKIGDDGSQIVYQNRINQYGTLRLCGFKGAEKIIIEIRELPDKSLIVFGSLNGM